MLIIDTNESRDAAIGKVIRIGASIRELRSV